MKTESWSSRIGLFLFLFASKHTIYVTQTHRLLQNLKLQSRATSHFSSFGVCYFVLVHLEYILPCTAEIKHRKSLTQRTRLMVPIKCLVEYSHHRYPPCPASCWGCLHLAQHQVALLIKCITLVLTVPVVSLEWSWFHDCRRLNYPPHIQQVPGCILPLAATPPPPTPTLTPSPCSGSAGEMLLLGAWASWCNGLV